MGLSQTRFRKSFLLTPWLEEGIKLVIYDILPLLHFPQKIAIGKYKLSFGLRDLPNLILPMLISVSSFFNTWFQP